MNMPTVRTDTYEGPSPVFVVSYVCLTHGPEQGAFFEPDDASLVRAAAPPEWVEEVGSFGMVVFRVPGGTFTAHNIGAFEFPLFSPEEAAAPFN